MVCYFAESNALVPLTESKVQALYTALIQTVYKIFSVSDGSQIMLMDKQKDTLRTVCPSNITAKYDR